MLVTTPSTPDECPQCQSENLTWQELGNGDNVVICHACGVWIKPQDVNMEPEVPSLTASVFSCPHCREVGEIQVAGGEEWCAGCGLDPSQATYPSSEIAKLWKEGSRLRDMMEKDLGALDPTTKMGAFLRDSCGPSCSYASECPQSATNFTKCFGEYRKETLGASAERDMGKKNRHNHQPHQQYKVSKKERKRLAREEALRKKRAVFMCSAGGFFSARLSRDKESIETDHAKANYQE